VPFGGWVGPVDHSGELLLGEVAGLLDSQNTILAYNTATGPRLLVSILDDKCFGAAGFNANAKTAQFAVPKKGVALSVGFERLDGAFS
jgi:hypothetical protein